MKKIGLIVLVAAFAAACNNSGNSTNQADSTAVKDKTNVYDTTIGNTMTDTSRHMDTSLLPNKMQDTGMKK
jgi:hypothetical protein